MKNLLVILSSLALVTSGSSVAVINASSISANYQTKKSEVQSVFAGTKTVNVGLELEVTDVAMGSAKQKDAPASHNVEWSDIQIDKTIVPKMDYTRSWIKLDISHWYSDNSGKGHWNNFNVSEDLIITNSNFDSKVREYNDERHHSGGSRSTDHQWKWQAKVNQEGIYLWDWVWVWANGNWGNKAQSIAGININSFEYHFEFLV